MSTDPIPPIAQQSPRELTTHGDNRIDPYYWLREKSNPATIAYLEAENAYMAAVMKDAEALETKIYDEILGRIKQTDLTVPVKDGDYLYYSRTEEGKQYPIYCRKRASNEAEEAILDCNQLAQGLDYFQLGAFAVSDDHHFLAYSIDSDGSERYTVHVKNLATGELLADTIPLTSEGVTWAAANETLFYTTFDETKRPYRVHRHKLGTDPSNDEIVFTESDTQFAFSVGKTRSKQYILIETANPSTTCEVLYLDAHRPEQPFQVIEPRRVGVEYYADHQGGNFLIRTNADGASTFKLMTVPAEKPGRANWRPLIPERSDATLDGIEAFQDFLVLHMRERGLPTLTVRDLTNGEQHAVEFPEPSYNVVPQGNAEYRTNLIRFEYTSLITPPSVYDYDMRDKHRTLLKQTEVLGGYDPSRYTAERIYATAPDGTRIPVSLVHRKDLHSKDFVRNGQSPMLLYAYGSYGINIDPSFSYSVISLVDRGFIYAIAHVRGGSDNGRQWFEEGRLLKKKNTFTDFIACAEHLIAERYTSPAQLAVQGGSAGGLLMGAVLNMRPDLFHAVVAQVPFVDVVTTMLDPTIPLTTGEYDQWGNPEEKVYYDYMKSYSPYDNVKAQDYPNILITTGLNDPRVAFWEPAKWTAKLRATKTDRNLILLKTNMGAGHGGPSGRYERIKETAFVYTFLLRTFGIAI